MTFEQAMAKLEEHIVETCDEDFDEIAAWMCATRAMPTDIAELREVMNERKRLLTENARLKVLLWLRNECAPKVREPRSASALANFEPL